MTLELVHKSRRICNTCINAKIYHTHTHEKNTWDCVNSKREYIIVLGEDLELGINLRRTIVIGFYNSEFIRNLSYCFSI